jgi:hypothetical protein
MMFVHAEKARKSLARPVLPTATTANKASLANPDKSWSPDTWYTEKTIVHKDGTQTREIAKHTKNPDGSITVEETVEEEEVDL